MHLLEVGSSPIIRLDSEMLRQREISLIVKRDDLVHPVIQGNKFRKLKYNLLDILSEGISEVITCGGAYSNHLLAMSQAGRLFGFKTVGLVNAAYADLDNPTLSACRDNGMLLKLLDKSGFKAIVNQYLLSPRAGNSLFIPEGGSNEAALTGVGELYQEIISQVVGVTDIIVPCGSGGTLAGLFLENNPGIRIIGVPVLKIDMYAHLRKVYPARDFNGVCLWDDAHVGGYAKFDATLIDFIKSFFATYGIVLDPIYNGKAMQALFNKIENGYFDSGASIVYVHTGGHQGIKGFNERFGTCLPE